MMRVLVWFVHGGWMNSFLRGPHDYLVVADDSAALHPAMRLPNVQRVDLLALRDAQVDVVVLQNILELNLASRYLGRIVGKEIAAVFVEHNTPQLNPVAQVHPLADQQDILIAHVTHFNSLMWDTGKAKTHVIEHGLPDPDWLYTGELARIGVVINEPVRRSRFAGTDLLQHFSTAGPVDCFGIDSHLLSASANTNEIYDAGNLAPDVLHEQLAKRRVYLHPYRWTSLGLALLEAMSLGMPVIVLATTEAARAVPPEAGAISTNIADLVSVTKQLMEDPDEAKKRGNIAREFARRNYSLTRFVVEWNEILEGAKNENSNGIRARQPIGLPRQR